MNPSIVIPLGRGSKWNNIELRYCLRSIEKHLYNYGEIFIIGDLPGWVRNVTWIPADDGSQTYEKERNIFNKIMLACWDERVTDNFLFMNDDHYLLQEYEAGNFPYYYSGFVQDVMTVTDYKHTLRNTLSITPHALYADIHCPILYDKDRFKGQRLNWGVKYGYCIKTLYCAFYEHGARTMVEYSDLKISQRLTAEQIKERIAGRGWFSIGDGAFDGQIRQVLEELYPVKSKYEL